MSDYRWLNDLSQSFLENGYLLPGQTVDERVTIIAETAESILNLPGYAEKFKEYFKKGWFSLSTPIWCNFGHKRGMPISCFGSYITDDLISILDTHAEVGMMSKVGGGTSGYFGNLRHRGAPITDNGESFGSVHFMRLFDNLINIVSQGNTRRGNFAAYLPIEHPDIEEFLDVRKEGNPIQDLYTGITVTDQFMEEMIAGDTQKRKVWAKVIEARTNTGFPYIVFIDTANKNTVDVYKDQTMKITHSNLCVTGDQRVVSNRGMKTAKQLYEEGGTLQLWDNNKVVNASSMRLIEKNADVYKVTLDNGMSHTITKYHKILTSKYDNCHKEKNEIKTCDELQVGDRVAIQTTKGLFGDIHMPKEAFLLGLYQADGTQTKNDICLDVWENDFDLIDEIQENFNYIHYEYNCDTYAIISQGMTCIRNRKPTNFYDCVISNGIVKKKRLTSRTLKKALNFEKGSVPDWIYESDEETQWQYIRGLLYADGTVFVSKSKGNPLQLSLANIDKNFLQQVQLIFANLGLQSSIRLLREAGQQLLPDGKGGQKYYDTKDCWRLIIGNKNDALTVEKNTGFLARKGFEIEDREYRNNTKKYYEIISIEHVGQEDVFCCKVDSDEHLWVCNGFITHNCSEIMLPDSETESFVCDLSSMNILYFDEWKDTDAVEVLTFLLDAVMTEFIQKAEKIPHMQRAVKFARRHRALGIGWFGWHSYLQSKMIAFESMDAKMNNILVAKTIQDKAWEASKKLAEMYGEPELLEGYGRRNTTLTAIAPTKSSSFLIGQASEGIEPHRTNYCIKDLQKGKFTLRNQHLQELLHKKGKDTPEVWESIAKNSGSVQHLDFLDEHEKDVFKTFIEIAPKEIIIQASQRQKYVDQSQSLNLLIDPKVPVKDMNTLYIEAWKLGVKSLYYQISVNAAQQLTRFLQCKSCEG